MDAKISVQTFVEKQDIRIVPKYAKRFDSETLSQLMSKVNITRNKIDQHIISYSSILVLCKNVIPSAVLLAKHMASFPIHSMFCTLWWLFKVWLRPMSTSPIYILHFTFYILQNNWSSKVRSENAGKDRNTMKEAKWTWQLNVRWDPGLEKGR